MHSQGVAFLIGIGAAVTSWFRKGRFQSGDKSLEQRGSARGREASSSWPEGLPRVQPGQFLLKWSRKLGRKLVLRRRKSSPDETAGVAARGGAKALSLRIAAAINYLYWPFVWSGFALTAWFCADFLFQLLLSASTYQVIAQVSAPLLAIVTPTAVGFWTNWLAIKMIFYPRRQNAVWWGLVPARRTELIDSIATGVMKQLISPEIVRAYLHKSGLVQRFVNQAAEAVKETMDHPQFRMEIKGLVYGFVHDFATSPETRRSVEELVRKKIHEWTGGTLGEKIAEWTKALWGPMVLNEVGQVMPELPRAMDRVLARLDDFLDKVPALMERESGRIEDIITKGIVEALHNLDIRQVVKSQLDKMHEQELEKMLTSTVTTELRFIQTSGGVFGLLAGIAFVFPKSRPWLLAVGIGLWIAYRATVKKETRS